jgi:hypothetical protein
MANSSGLAKPSILRNLEFWASLSIIVVVVFFLIADKIGWVHFGYFVGPFRLNHWFVWIGTLYVAFAVPIIALLKWRFPTRFMKLFRVHVFGNLLAFLLVSIHFAGQIDRPLAFYPELGTGLSLYIIMILLVASGFSLRFRLIPQLKSQTQRIVHVGLTSSFYIIIVIHILHGLNFL